MSIHALTVMFPDRQSRLICDVVLSTENKELTVPALWDTGATGSAVSHEVVSWLELSVFGKQLVSTPTDTKEVDTFCVDVRLPNNVNFEGLVVIDSEIGNQDIGMLIGMDIIGRGDFALTNNNDRTTFTYRYPPSGSIDFVKDANLREAMGPKHGKGKGKGKK